MEELSVEQEPIINDPVLPIPVNTSSIITPNAVLPDNYVLYCLPLNRDQTPMVGDLYEVERRTETDSVPVVGDFVPAALVARPLEADIQSLPDLRGLVQEPLKPLDQTLAVSSKFPKRKVLYKSKNDSSTLAPFVPPPTPSLPPPPPPVVVTVYPTYREHRAAKWPGSSEKRGGNRVKPGTGGSRHPMRPRQSSQYLIPCGRRSVSVDSKQEL